MASKSGAAGSTFSKARFTAGKSPDNNNKGKFEDVDIEDPEFWTKMLGEPSAETEHDVVQPRQRNKTNYSEKEYMKSLDKAFLGSDQDNSSDDDEEDDDEDESVGDENAERGRWGGSAWKREHVESLLRALQSYGYGRMTWEAFIERLDFGNRYSCMEVGLVLFAVTLT